MCISFTANAQFCEPFWICTTHECNGFVIWMMNSNLTFVHAIEFLELSQKVDGDSFHFSVTIVSQSRRGFLTLNYCSQRQNVVRHCCHAYIPREDVTDSFTKKFGWTCLRLGKNEFLFPFKLADLSKLKANESCAIPLAESACAKEYVQSFWRTYAGIEGLLRSVVRGSRLLRAENSSRKGEKRKTRQHTPKPKSRERGRLRGTEEQRDDDAERYERAESAHWASLIPGMVASSPSNNLFLKLILIQFPTGCTHPLVWRIPSLTDFLLFGVDEPRASTMNMLSSFSRNALENFLKC